MSSWYNEESQENFKSGNCLLEALDKFTVRKKAVQKATRVCIYDYYNKGQDASSAVSSNCVSVKIESGILKEQDQLILMPIKMPITVKAIEKR